ncbi:MAG TPA: hypothetical protein PLB10_19215 [Thiolinea sp.]|nr:hypothetical protein [Thiolinea sp.]
MRPTHHPLPPDNWQPPDTGKPPPDHDRQQQPPAAGKPTAPGIPLPNLTPVPWREYYSVTVLVVALLAAAFAAFKTLLVWQSFGLAGALVFAGLHLPMALFGALFAAAMVYRHPGMALLGVATSVLNALLI